MMFRDRKYSLSALFLIGALLALPACAAEEPTNLDDAGEDAEDLEAKADGASVPLGTFENMSTERRAGTWRTLVLRRDVNDDYRYLLLTSPRAGTTVVPQEGQFKFTRYRERKYIRLLDFDGNLVERVEYIYAPSAAGEARVAIRKLNSDTFTSFRRLPSTGFCSVADDCYGQGLSVPADCNARYNCEASVCSRQCGGGGFALVLRETSADTELVRDELESDHGSVGGEDNLSEAMLLDYTPPADADLSMDAVLLGAVNTLVDEGIIARGGVSPRGTVSEAEFNRALAAWGYAETLVPNVRTIWEVSPEDDEWVSYGKLVGRGVTLLSGAQEPATITAYVVRFFPSNHVLLVYDLTRT